MATALPISPSTEWLGNDGSWNVFDIRVGTPPQTVQVLPWTAASAVLVVLTQGCPQTSAPDDCSSRRGGIMNLDPTEDSSFQPVTPSDGYPYFALPFEAEQNLGIFSANSLVGYDKVSLGSASSGAPSLQTQVVAGFAAKLPFIGLLGLSPWPNHVVNASTSQPSTIGYLRSTNSIPSTSWAYTAGKSYENVLASLTIGGYDRLRGNTNDVLTSSMPNTTQCQHMVAVNAISISGRALNGLGQYTYCIDSAIADLWLPATICSQFEEAFGLTWNNTANMYTVNDTQHSALLQANLAVSLTVARTSGTSSPFSTTQITLPYAAFDLNASWPLSGGVNSSSVRYFPLKRGNATTGYFLGRTFLQEAYLSADYDRRQFNLSQAISPDSSVILQRDIVTIFPPANATNSSTVSTASDNAKNTPLSSGSIAGIAVGVAIFACLCLVAFLYLRNRKRQHAEKERDMKLSGGEGEPLNSQKPELDATMTARERQELEAGNGHVKKSGTQTEIAELGDQALAEMRAEREAAELEARNKPVEMP